jgi:hypothetical protein
MGSACSSSSATGSGGGGSDGGGEGVETATIGGQMLCPLGWSGTPGAVASGGTIHLGILDQMGAAHPLSCAGGAGNVNELAFAPIPSPGTSSPCTSLRVIQGMLDSYCNADPTGSLTHPTGMITVTGAIGDLFVSGSCSCSGSPATPETSTVDFSNIPLRVQ